MTLATAHRAETRPIADVVQTPTEFCQEKRDNLGTLSRINPCNLQLRNTKFGVPKHRELELGGGVAARGGGAKGGGRLAGGIGAREAVSREVLCSPARLEPEPSEGL